MNLIIELFLSLYKIHQSLAEMGVKVTELI